jgi:iron complex outermembrane receptor protein
MRTSLFFGALLLAGRLAAQDAEIVVTATKEPAPADTLPVPVVVIGSEALADKASVSDALEGSLAVRLQSQTPGQPALVAPGFGENGFGRVSLLLDGVPQNNPDMAAPPLDLVPVFAIDRIEIVRGPLAALYGSGAGGGVVNLVTKVPNRLAFQAGVSAELTGTNTQTAAFGVPIASGGLLVSLSRDQEQLERDRSNSDNYQGWSKFSLPFGNQEISASLGFTRAHTQLPGALTEAEYNDDPDKATNPSDSALRTETSGNASWSFSGTGWKLEVPVSGLVRAVTNTTASFLSNSDSTLIRTTVEPQVSGKSSWWGAYSDWVVGVSGSADGLFVSRHPYPASSAAPVSADIHRLTGATWGRGQLDWDDRWIVSATVRAEVSRTEARSDEAVIDGQRDFFPVAADLGLTWLPAEGLKAAVQISRIYRYPFIDEMVSAYGFGADAFYSNVDAEVGHGATGTGEWKTGPWTFSASGTVLRMENEIAVDPVTFLNANLGPVWHASTLAGVTWTSKVAASTLTLGGQYEGERAVFADGPNDGRTVPLIPSHRGRFSAQLADRGWGTAEAGWTLTSSYYQGGDNGNSLSQVRGKQQLDASVAVFVGSKEWVLRVYGKNLTDDRTPDFVGYGGWYPAQGRVLGVSLNWTM